MDYESRFTLECSCLTACIHDHSHTFPWGLDLKAHSFGCSSTFSDRTASNCMVLQCSMHIAAPHMHLQDAFGVLSINNGTCVCLARPASSRVVQQHTWNVPFLQNLRDEIMRYCMVSNIQYILCESYITVQSSVFCTTVTDIFTLIHIFYSQLLQKYSQGMCFFRKTVFRLNLGHYLAKRAV